MPRADRRARRRRASGRLFLGVVLTRARCVWRHLRPGARRAGCIITLFLSFVFASGALRAQTAVLDTTLQRQALRVFLDVPIDEDFVKTRTPFVNYVRDRFDADVHVRATTLATAIGGIEYTVFFAGQKRYAGMDDTLRYVSRPTEAVEARQTGVVNVIKMGLMRYVGRTPLASGMIIYYRYRPNPANLIDPWDYWHFGVSTSGNFNGDENGRGSYAYGSFSARRVTPALKVYLAGSYSYDRTRTTLPTKVLTYTRRSSDFDAQVVKSLSNHWSAGGSGYASTWSYGREKSKVSLAPALEFDVFPYAEITTKEFRFLYALRYIEAVYQQMTIFNKTSENLFSEDLTIDLDVKMNWGTIGGTLVGSHYFHDASKYRLSASFTVMVEIFKGFTFDVGSSYRRIHDEIDTPRGKMTDEDILLGLQEMASSYDYSVSMGFSYNFGSKFANIVNRRFGTSY
jgi:hypothetical protein